VSTPAIATRLRTWLARRGGREIIAFLFVGLSNTALTYATYLGLLQVLHYPWAYTGAFLVGLAYTGLLNIRVTFSRHPTVAAWVAFTAYYTLYWVCSIGLLRLLVDGFGVPKAYGPLVMLPIVVPINFVVTRLIVHRFAEERR
jgi:putative flippase GtrA